MSRAYDQGYEEATNVYGPLRSKDWHSLAHAEGWIYGLNCLIENYQMTEVDEYTTQEYLDEKIVDLEFDSFFFNLVSAEDEEIIGDIYERIFSKLEKLEVL